MAFRWPRSNPPPMGFCRSSYARAAVLRASKAANCSASRRSGTFLRTSVPGYRYGSESSLIQLIDRSTELFEADLAIDVPLEDALRFVIQVQVLDAKVSDGRNERPLPLHSFLLADWSRGCCLHQLFYHALLLFRPLRGARMAKARRVESAEIE